MGNFGRSMSVTKWARQREKKYISVVGECKRVTPAAVLFASTEYRTHEIDKDELWFPRCVIEQGDAIEVGDNEIRVGDWWIAKLQGEHPTGGATP